MSSYECDLHRHFVSFRTTLFVSTFRSGNAFLYMLTNDHLSSTTSPLLIRGSQFVPVQNVLRGKDLIEDVPGCTAPTFFIESRNNFLLSTSVIPSPHQHNKGYSGGAIVRRRYRYDVKILRSLT